MHWFHVLYIISLCEEHHKHRRRNTYRLGSSLPPEVIIILVCLRHSVGCSIGGAGAHDVPAPLYTDARVDVELYRSTSTMCPIFQKTGRTKGIDDGRGELGQPGLAVLQQLLLGFDRLCLERSCLGSSGHRSSSACSCTTDAGTGARRDDDRVPMADNVDRCIDLDGDGRDSCISHAAVFLIFAVDVAKCIVSDWNRSGIY